MTRLIDADEMKMSKCPAVVNEYTKGWNDAIDAIIENAPTIDAKSHWIPCNVRLPVRCKDCKHWQCDDSESYCDELGIFDTDMNSYCSYAKRKEE